MHSSDKICLIRGLRGRVIRKTLEIDYVSDTFHLVCIDDIWI